MQSKSTRRSALIRWALTLLALCFVTTPARGAEPAQFKVEPFMFGLTPGQTARFTVVNPAEPIPTEQTRQVSVVVEMMDARGGLVARSHEVAIPPGEFRSLDFHRRNLPLAGEAGTGRLQAQASCWIRVSGSWAKADELAVTLELIEDGTSSTFLIAERYLHTDGPYVITGVEHAATGLIPGQTLRFSVAHPNETAGGQREGVRAQVRLYDARGDLIAQSAVATIPAGAFHSFDFNRAALPLAGEAGTGRLQVQLQTQLFIARQQTVRAAPMLFPAALEIVDNSTGQTALLPAVQQLRCNTSSNGEIKCRIVSVH